MKYSIVCSHCGRVIGDFAAWFDQGQQCTCGSKRVEIIYPEFDYERLKAPQDPTADSSSQFALYFDCLPLESRENIVSMGEGTVPIERWPHLEEKAARNGVRCEVYVCRHDLNGGTGTFKDIGASLAASVLKEHHIQDYCLASTGNAAVAFAAYLRKAGIRFTHFAPGYTDEETLEAVRRTGQHLVVSQGDYGAAKREAEEFSRREHVLISGGNIDPLRIESKRTLVFECLRQMKDIPSVYIQAVAGGTGVLAFDKGIRELKSAGYRVENPRMILVQQDECDPMVRAWERARENGFPDGWTRDYAPRENVHTRIHILTAANPGNYPLLAPIVRQSGGCFLRVEERNLPAFGRDMMNHRNLLMGPASMVCYSGFCKALENGLIHNGDKVLLNTGEGCMRAFWFRNEVQKF